MGITASPGWNLSEGKEGNRKGGRTRRRKQVEAEEYDEEEEETEEWEEEELEEKNRNVSGLLQYVNA